MLERIQWFYQLLKQHRYPTGQQYMTQFEISRSTFKRDMEFFRDRLGAPLHYDRSRKGYYLSDDAFELPAFWLNRSHLAILAGICHQLQWLAVDSTDEIGKLYEKVNTMLSLKDGRQFTELISFENVECCRFDYSCFNIILTAMADRRCICITYDTAYSGQTNRRVVEPYKIHVYMGSWHLVGFCRLRNEPRFFLLTRIREITLLDEHFHQNKFDVNAFIEDTFGIYRGKHLYHVSLKFSPEISRIIRDEVWHKDQTIEENSDGSLILNLVVSELTEIRRMVLKYESHVKVLEPKELQQQVVEQAKRILQLYGQWPPS